MTILIFQFEPFNDPGYFGRHLEKNDIDYDVVRVDQGDPIPPDVDRVSGLVFMGSVVSVNDNLPWVQPILRLIRRGHKIDLPMLGHCLGGQLISRALGGQVTRNPVEEIGWFPLKLAGGGNSPGWWSDLPTDPVVFHWHNETFSIPEGAIHLFGSEHCATQAFQVGNAIGLQFHLEITNYMVREWSLNFGDLSRATQSNIQSPQTMTENLDKKVETSEALAEKIYSNWCGSLVNAHRG